MYGVIVFIYCPIQITQVYTLPVTCICFRHVADPVQYTFSSGCNSCTILLHNSYRPRSRGPARYSCTLFNIISYNHIGKSVVSRALTRTLMVTGITLRVYNT